MDAEVIEGAIGAGKTEAEDPPLLQDGEAQNATELHDRPVGSPVAQFELTEGFRDRATGRERKESTTLPEAVLGSGQLDTGLVHPVSEHAPSVHRQDEPIARSLE
jgi:hypothetical protein